MTKLYELQEQLVKIDSIISDNTNPETNEILQSAKDDLLNEINGNIESLLDYIAECKSKIDFYKNEEKRIADKRKSLENRVDWLKSLLYGQMKLENKTKAEYGTYSLSIAKTPAKVIIDDDQWLPDAMCKIERVPDKAAIKESMVDGKFVVVVDGQQITVAHTENGESLRIK